jgi:hypothetical protein
MVDVTGKKLVFSDFLSEQERNTIREGWVSFINGFFKKNIQKSKYMVEKHDDLRLSRILGDTTRYLYYAGDPANLHILEDWARVWESMGEKKVADAFKVRIAEAKYEEPHITIDEPDEYSFIRSIDPDEEEAPITQRSIAIAKALQFANILIKAAG